jgi:hypothetical protein
MTTGRMITDRVTPGRMTAASMRPAVQALTSPRESLDGRGAADEAGAGRS